MIKQIKNLNYTISSDGQVDFLNKMTLDEKYKYNYYYKTMKNGNVYVFLYDPLIEKKKDIPYHH